MSRQRHIKGTPVAPGLAMGSVHVVRAARDRVPTWSIPEQEVLDEIGRLHGAIDHVCDELESRRSLVAEQANEQDANILAVHGMIVRDPSAIAEVEKRIREDRLNAEACVQSLIERLVSSMSGMDEENIKGYAADVSEPWRAVLEELMEAVNQNRGRPKLKKCAVGHAKPDEVVDPEWSRQLDAVHQAELLQRILRRVRKNIYFGTPQQIKYQ